MATLCDHCKLCVRDETDVRSDTAWCSYSAAPVRPSEVILCPGQELTPKGWEAAGYEPSDKYFDSWVKTRQNA